MCTYVAGIYGQTTNENTCGLATQQQVSRIQPPPIQVWIWTRENTSQIPKPSTKSLNNVSFWSIGPSLRDWQGCRLDILGTFAREIQSSGLQGPAELKVSRTVSVHVHQQWPKSQEPRHIPLSMWEAETRDH